MKPTILVIEDNEQNLYLVTYLLTKSGYEVVQARDGNEGVEAASRVKPSLILLDIQLPDTDGYAVTRALKAIPELTGVPIVAVTSYAMVGDRERILATGCTGYLEKPIDPDSFVGEVESHLERPSPERARGEL